MRRLGYVKKMFAQTYKEWASSGGREHRKHMEIINGRVYATPEDVLECLYQMHFVQGKRWLDYIDSLPSENVWTMDREPLEEGFCIPNSLIGRFHK